MRITTNNGTTISGSLSEVLAILTHLGVKAPSTKPVTTVNVSGTMVTKADDVDKIAQSITAKLHAGETVTPEATPKLTRDDVIQQAIADVEALLWRNYPTSSDVANFVGESLWFTRFVYDAIDEVLFTVNADKRTVHAIVRRIRSQTETSKGRAKCAPDDVFNEHIGKAIALRRALGLAVPVEYYEVEARDSDDLAVGDVVQNKKYDYFSTIVSLIENPEPVKYPGSAHRNDKLPGWNASSQVTLINDSARHTAPDLEVSRIIRH